MTFKVQVVGIDQTIRQVNDELRSAVKRLANDLFTEVVKTTPVKTGAARGGWTKKVTDRDFELSNNVPYVPVLDKGRHMTARGMRGSKQAPNGIVGPSLKSIKGNN
jgi:uracil phosphoribosyltransferase